jgi:dTDP-4-amino-4,6-dideoxygalactose transaminase
MLRQYGWQNKYQIEAQGGRNSRLDEIQAAILSLKLPYLENWNHRRYRIAQRYAEGIVHPAVRLPRVQPGSYVGHLFVVQTEKRSALRRHLADHAIASDIHYPIPDYLQPALSPLFPDVRLKVTEIACEQVLTLPCFPEMKDEEVSGVISAVNCWSES